MLAISPADLIVELRCSGSPGEAMVRFSWESNKPVFGDGEAVRVTDEMLGMAGGSGAG